ncbi:NAD(P)H-hydrate epimerase [Staphylococcus chromogenes]|nr:NAD(P)H-hydrate epimerase [Staphylococcus chromogenes]
MNALPSRDFSPVYLPDQIRAAEAPLLAAVGSKLMHEAAYAVALEAKKLLRQHRKMPYGARILVLAGRGNNAGDALIAAAELEKSGATVYVWLTAETTHEQALAMIKYPKLVQDVPKNIDLVLDGIVGIGARGGLDGEPARAVAAVAGLPVLAVDLPSGVDPVTGHCHGAHISAERTVTFGGLKPAHVRGWEHCGEVKVHGLGIDKHLGKPFAWEVRKPSAWPYPGPNDNKYTTGVVGIRAGSAQYPGAAVLAVHGAVNATSAMVRYVGPCARGVTTAHPEVVACESMAAAGKVQAWVYGPGVGVDKQELLEMLERPEPLVLDADAITTLAASQSCIAAMCERDAVTVLTPHGGEFARITTAQTAQQLAQELGICVLLKGRVTEVAYGDELYLIEAGSSWAATPGSGDVLAGVIGAAIAWEPSAEMVANAVRMHADAATLCGGPVPASDIARALSQVVRP